MIQSALTTAGYDPVRTPVDVLMAAPVGVHLGVAEAMEDDGDYPDDDLRGFHEADLVEEHMDLLLGGVPFWEECKLLGI